MPNTCGAHFSAFLISVRTTTGRGFDQPGVITENSQRRTLSEKNNFITWLRAYGLRDILIDGGKKPNFHCENRVQN